MSLFGRRKAQTPAEKLRAAGSRLLERNKIGPALEKLRAAIELEPSSFDGRINLGTACYLAKELDEAEKHFRYVLALDEHHPAALLNLAAVCDAKGDLDASIGYLEKLLHARPKWKDGHYNLAIAYLRKGEKVRAREALKQELQISPDNRSARELLNRLYLEIGE